MLTRTTLIAATAALGLTGAAMADGAKAPTILDDQALDSVIAGTRVITFDPTLNYHETNVGVDFDRLLSALETAGSVEQNVIVIPGPTAIYVREDNKGVNIFRQ